MTSHYAMLYEDIYESGVDIINYPYSEKGVLEVHLCLRYKMLVHRSMDSFLGNNKENVIIISEFIAVS